MTTPARPARRRLVAAGVLVAVLLGLAACAAQANALAAPAAGPGFWLGLWHGFICPIAFLISLFNDHVGIYAVHNSGRMYDFGFVVGVVIGAGVFHSPFYARRRAGKGD
ncbi:hypothetical protein [Amycolatopsis benzoatilytica]|uniref:hypothetical protein n=1 Tax=Amycolatopsis benzoatilytica TaxID=346045 RepID=UPI0006865D6F|nr:hypothetical protein [Amycolatopsis benzoatilytica]